MRRWNGWGDASTAYPLPEPALHYLQERLGLGVITPDVTLKEAVAAVPAARLGEHALITTQPHDRLLHARGQSLPDWVALRSGIVGAFPDGVAYPHNREEVRVLLAWASQAGVRVIPYGGGTSVTGHINPLPGDTPVLTIDLSRLNQLVALDEISQLATFEAGITGPALERGLNERGFTLGHFPQSWELSTLGGWIAARSSGQQSYHYGRIEDLFAGGQVETLRGPLELPPLPASAAGPDLRQLVLGSEGRLGVITQATVRIRPLPEFESFYGIFFKDWGAAVDAVRQVAQEKVPVSMLRLSNAQETETTLALTGKEQLVAWAGRGLGWLGFPPERCLLIYGVTGSRRSTALARARVNAIARARGGLFTGTFAGRTWRKSRFLTPYLRNTLWERGYAIDTLETALPWSRVVGAAQAIQDALRAPLAASGEKVLVLAHLSHVYRDGASIYITYLFRRAADPAVLLERWQKLKHNASQEIVAWGGTISHQHGVGRDHAPYLAAEKGELGLELVRSALQACDPHGLLNPGKLLP